MSVAAATPNFFIVGAAKAGTTSLCDYLEQHPAVFISPIKEPCFFAPEVVDLTARARQLFDADQPALAAFLDGPQLSKRASGIVLEWEQYLKLFRGVRGETAIGEASVSYLGSMGAPRALATRVPDARIVMMLRDPADRLFSHYVAARAVGATDLDYVSWVEGQRRGQFASPPSGPVWAGRYGLHLQRYRDCFPARQLHVMLYDDFVRAPAETLRGLLAFLGVDSEVPIDMRRRRNVTTVPRWPVLYRTVPGPAVRAVKTAMPDGLAARLRRWWRRRPDLQPVPDERAAIIALHEKEIRALERAIDRDLSGWLDPSPPPRT